MEVTPKRGSDPDFDPTFGYVLAVFGPILAAAALVPVREHILNANAALLLVVVVVLSAVAGGRGAGATAAVISALSYDFFLTRPYLSLTIDSEDDVETTVLLLVIGLLVGEIIVRARRSHAAATRGRGEIETLHQVAERAAAGAEADEMTAVVCGALADLLSLDRCELERPPYGPPLPRLERSGAVVGTAVHRVAGGEFTLPPEGVELPVMGRGKQLARLVFTPRPGVGVSLEERIVAVALSDQLGAVLAASPA